VVGFLILAGAVNTAIVGSNGVLNRVAEDGVLPDALRVPHRRYGTTSRIINLVVALQVFTIIASRGDVYVLGEAYAFGVVWSFVFKALSMVVLRFKDRRPREWRVPGNLRIGRVELPLGLAAIFLVLLAVALVNLVTKRVATEWGIAFTVLLFGLFWASERLHQHGGAVQHLEKFNLRYTPDLDPRAVGVARPGCTIVPVRDPANLRHLDRVLAETDGRPDVDVVVPTIKVDRELVATGSNPNFSPDEQSIFTAVVTLAEKHGKPVIPLVLVSNDVFFAIARAAQELGAGEVVLGKSGKLAPDVQADTFAIRWGAVEPSGERELTVRIVSEREDLRFTI
jgi:amino acid permease-like protein